ncbi:MAG: RNA polymerase sigma factor [Verrucomicrobiales bacterium]
MNPADRPEQSGPDEDALLMLRAARGDDQAFAQLVERHQRPLLNFFLRSGASDESEDLVQKTFVRLYRYRDRYQPVARFVTFLYHLARNVWIEETRAQARKHRLFNALREEERERSSPSSSAPSGAAMDAATALAALSPKLRDVVVLHIYRGLRYHEIAEVLGIPEGTVKSRMNLAMSALRKTLHENE